MSAPLVRGLRTVLGAPNVGNWRFIKEPQVGDVKPDLLVALGPGATRRPFRGSPKPTYTEAAVLGLIEHRGLANIDDIKTSLYLPHRTVNSIVARLTRRGYVCEAAGNYRAVERVRSTEVELLAVELKLYRWREALHQAARYRRFAERSLVVLDGNRVSVTSAMLNEFRSAGCGLWLQFGHVVSEVIPAEQGLPNGADRYAAILNFYL